MSKPAVVLSEHARAEAARRGIAEETAITVASEPEQIVPQRPGREIRQSRVTFPPGGETYLVRVVVDVLGSENTVVTVYRTRKIEKYWRES
jgi:Ethanolamine utilization protein EutJ (predicted chaperonin)